MMLVEYPPYIPTLQEIVEFVLVNREGTKAFMPLEEWTKHKIESVLFNALRYSCATYSVKDNKVVALGYGHFENEDVFHVSNTLSIDEDGFASCLIHWKTMYPNIKFFSMFRRGKLKIISANKIYNKFI